MVLNKGRAPRSDASGTQAGELNSGLSGRPAFAALKHFYLQRQAPPLRCSPRPSCTDGTGSSGAPARRDVSTVCCCNYVVCCVCITVTRPSNLVTTAPTKTSTARFRRTWSFRRTAVVFGCRPVCLCPLARSTSRGFRSTINDVR
jgi:hypothetical protein